MGGFIALYVTACLNLASPGSCATELVTDSTQNQMTMTGCLGVEGLSSAKEFVENHPLYHTWQLQRLELPDRQQARSEEGAGMSRSGRCEPTVSVHSNEDSDDNRLGEFI
jgi:hypothetical protein